MNPDQDAIEAVKQGERDRFAELVERHKRMVYAIAWSYLGDAEICEDAAQETFIRAFRYLGALRDAGKFPAWLGRIARNVSTTLLRRRRAELEQRKRWLTQQAAAAPDAPAGADDEENLKAMLGRTLAELPPRHRECLVLFYLEGKSVLEAAAMLGLSEAALKTRLHRARQALRGRLERQIERGLDGLAPRKDFVDSVMLLLPAKPLGLTGVGGGVTLVGKVATWLGKLLPITLFAAWMTVGQAAFFFLLLRWYGRMESANIIDQPQNAFRKVLLRREALTRSLAMLCATICVFFTIGHISILTFFQILAIYCVWGTYKIMRQLRVNRSLFTWGQVMVLLLFSVTIATPAFFSASLLPFPVVLLLVNIMLLRTNRDAPRRHDYNLFLRQASGMLGEPGAQLPPSRMSTEAERRAFARFLGGQWLVRDYAIRGSALLLRLAPLGMTLRNAYLMSNAGSSVALIQADGACRAFLSRSDAQAIAGLLKRTLDVPALEAGVGRVLQAAFALFLQGQTAEAQRLLSTLDDEAIFVTDFSKTMGYRRQHGIAIAASLFLVITMSCQPGFWSMGEFHWFQYWDPKPVTPAMVRQAASEWIRNDPRNSNFQALWSSPAHPSLALLGGENVDGYKKMIALELRMKIDDHEENASDCRIVNGLLYPTLLYHATALPILSAQELSALGFDPARMRKTLLELKNRRSLQLNGKSLCENLIHLPQQMTLAADGEEYQTIDIQTFARRLWLLKAYGCLDLLEAKALADEIAGDQITSKYHRPQGFAAVDAKQAAGLFHLGRCTLSETWAALWALETLGRLDLIDREACIAGILRCYRGNGSFRSTPPTKAGGPIPSAEDDTFYAMESLARLQALDRIKDFQKWSFHPVTQVVWMDNPAPRRNMVTASALRSCAYQERLERYQKSLKR